MQSLKRDRHEKALASSPDRLLVLHGYMATPEDHWFPWLAKRGRDLGMDVRVPRMADPQRPEASVWRETVRDQINAAAADLYVVAHSLGALAALAALSEVEPAAPLAGLILVSGFSRPLPAIPELDGFCTHSAWDVDSVRRKAPQRAIFLSEDDPLVPPEWTRDLASRLQAPVHALPGAGHFLATDGFTQFNAVYEALLAMRSVHASHRRAAAARGR